MNSYTANARTFSTGSYSLGWICSKNALECTVPLHCKELITVRREAVVINKCQSCLTLKKSQLIFKLKAPLQWVSWAVSFQVFHGSREFESQKKDGFFWNATSPKLRSLISSISLQRLATDSFVTSEYAGQWDIPHYSPYLGPQEFEHRIWPTALALKLPTPHLLHYCLKRSWRLLQLDRA